MPGSDDCATVTVPPEAAGAADSEAVDELLGDAGLLADGDEPELLELQPESTRLKPIIEVKIAERPFFID